MYHMTTEMGRVIKETNSVVGGASKTDTTTAYRGRGVQVNVVL